jgi:hypothetical protein
MLSELKVIWLYSLQELWRKYRQEDKLYGIAKARWNTGADEREFCMFLVKKGDAIVEAHGRGDISKQNNRYDFYDLSNSDFRLIMTGLAIDIIRLAAISDTDLRLWQILSNLFPDISKVN